MQALKDLLSLLYPPACLLCGTSQAQSPLPESRQPEESSLFCQACNWQRLRCEAPLCRQCGLSLPGSLDAPVLCRECALRPRAFKLARAPWQYRAALRIAIRQLKYGRRWRLGRWLAQEMAQTAQDALPLHRVDIVVPVPSHWLRRRLRGFDATAFLARHAAKILNRPYVADAVKRVRWTRSQTGLSWRKRQRNLQQAFRADSKRVANRGILLVDDVLTSGATAENCARALRQAGAGEVFVLAAARTPLD